MTFKRKLIYGIGAILLAVVALAAWKLGPALIPAKSVEAGIAVGAKAPVDLPLLDSKGRPTSLAARMGEKGLVLFMVRSADWCPFCKAQLIRTEEIRPAIAARGFGLASVSYDSPSKLEEFAQTKEIGFDLLSDQGSKLIDAMALRDPQYPEGNMAYGVPRSSVLILARDGTVLAKFVDEDYRSRQSNEQVLAMVEGAAR